MTAGNPHDGARDDAIAWFDALRQTPDDPAIVMAFMEWLKASEENATAWRRLETMQALARADAGMAAAHKNSLGSEDMIRLPGMHAPASRAILAADAALNGAASRAAISRPSSDRSGGGAATGRRRSIPVWARATSALAAAAACLIALVAGPDLLIDLRADYATEAGETRKVVLEDGSAVVLGAHSAIAVDFKPDSRRIEILRGVAFFDASPDARRPLVVTASGVRTRVTGTQFEVRSLAGGARVAVAEGTVAVRPEDVKRRIVPEIDLAGGQRVRVSDRGGASGQADLARVEAVAPDTVANWRHGALIVENWTVRELFDALSQHYRGVVLFADWTSGSDLTSGIYQLDEPLQALRLAAATQGLRLRRIAPGMVVISKL